MSTTPQNVSTTPETLPVADSQQLILAEAMRIVRGETMMLATKAHLKALAQFNDQLVKALRASTSTLSLLLEDDNAAGVTDNQSLRDEVATNNALILQAVQQ